MSKPAYFILEIDVRDVKGMKAYLAKVRATPGQCRDAAVRKHGGRAELVHVACVPRNPSAPPQQRGKPCIPRRRSRGLKTGLGLNTENHNSRN